METILETIYRLQNEKVAKRIVPDHVLLPDLMCEVQREVKSELRRLLDAGEIEVIQTINSVGIKINKK